SPRRAETVPTLLGGADPDADRAGHARPADPAVAARVLVQVLLVVVLGREERARLGDLGRDLAAVVRAQGLGVGVAGRERGVALLRRAPVDRGAVLAAVVVALAHALGRV